MHGTDFAFPSVYARCVCRIRPQLAWVRGFCTVMVLIRTYLRVCSILLNEPEEMKTAVITNIRRCHNSSLACVPSIIVEPKCTSKFWPESDFTLLNCVCLCVSVLVYEENEDSDEIAWKYRIAYAFSHCMCDTCQ